MKLRGLTNVGHGLLGFAALLGCADAEPSVEGPSGTRDIAGGDSPWWCLEQQPPPLPTPGRESVGFVLPVVEWGSLMPLAGHGLTATLCAGTQFSCEVPLTPPYAVTDGSLGATQLPPGVAGVPIFEGFDGFIRFEVMAPPATPSEQRFIPTNYYLGGTISGDVTHGPPLMMIQRGNMDIIEQSSFPEVDPLAIRDLGVVMLGAYDCNGAPAEDARIEIGNVGQATTVAPFLLPASRIPIAQPSDQPLHTGTSGLAGYLGVPPGAVQLRAFRRDETEPFGSTELGVVAGQLSVASIRPPYFVDANVEGPALGEEP